MHHKYVVRDGGAVWTGSTNWTDDSWTRQENVIVTVRSPKIAYAYALTFDQLWSSGQVANTGSDPRPQQVNGAQVRAWFCPEHGEALSHRVAKHIGRARKRVRIASPVLTSGPILATLVEVVNEGRCDVRGIVDDTQVDQVFHQWRTNGVSEWKVPLLRRVLDGAEFSGKASIPWTPESLHDFMHAKVVVADDTTFVGSFNFSRSGERNAENVLEIRHAAIAEGVPCLTAIETAVAAAEALDPTIDAQVADVRSIGEWLEIGRAFAGAPPEPESTLRGDAPEVLATIG